MARAGKTARPASARVRGPSVTTAAASSFGRDSPVRDVVERVRQVVGVSLASAAGVPHIERVAHGLGTSARTLQRWLATAGLTYAGVAQEARCAEARRMLREQRRKIGDVARALGYSDQAHFTRAFQRWMGVSPRAFRARGSGERGRRSSVRTRPKRRPA